jgi:hypothetical protein
MSISIYYTANRKQPLSDAERVAIGAAVEHYSVDNDIEEYLQTGLGFNWESFCIYKPDHFSEPQTIFEGATKLPDNSEDAIWTGLQHWCHLLTVIRNELNGAVWRVHVDDHEIVWDEAISAYDPSQ